MRREFSLEVSLAGAIYEQQEGTGSLLVWRPTREFAGLAISGVFRRRDTGSIPLFTNGSMSE